MSRVPPLPAEWLILTKAKTSTHHQNQLLHHYEPLIQRITQKTVYYHTEDDLQEARIAFTEAITQHTPTRGPFPAFAILKIRNRLIELSRRQTTDLDLRGVWQSENLQAPEPPDDRDHTTLLPPPTTRGERALHDILNGYTREQTAARNNIGIKAIDKDLTQIRKELRTTLQGGS